MRRAEGNGKERVGRAVFELLYQDLREAARSAGDTGAYQRLIENSLRNNAILLRHYSENFYCIIELIKASGLDQSLYRRIVKAQLSATELVVLLYFTTYSDPKRIAIAKEFGIFDQIDKNALMRPRDDLRDYMVA